MKKVQSINKKETHILDGGTVSDHGLPPIPVVDSPRLGVGVILGDTYACPGLGRWALGQGSVGGGVRIRGAGLRRSQVLVWGREEMRLAH